MYDTLHLRLRKEVVGDDMFYCLPILSNIAETTWKDGRIYITGNIGNCLVSISENGMSIKGSLSKFYLGSNLYTLTRKDTKLAFELMADTLHLPIHRAVVSRLDIGLNLETQYTPELYYRYLGPSNYYKRLTQPQSITYQNKRRSKKFYNKAAECRSTGVVLPLLYQDKNLLRYEVSYLQRLRSQFKIGVITPDTLTNEPFYFKLIDCWVNEYESINKVKSISMNTNHIRTPKDYLRQVAAMAILEQGIDSHLDYVDLLKNQNKFKKVEYYSRLRRDIRKLAATKISCDMPELIQELNQKVDQARLHFN
ncbi:phage/plasmid replication domain-containing protein [Pontibacter fetidus]|uniref:Replication-associated protein G2P N-terminal domain-containing protein n=1 Tax=Pontibacter fetidus TaxID=2700082 RepID=A0A6B2H137_9BACT|nr:phage/plasmid replication protein [Pontibacter fetidus]NDK56815.1 hypothetical protein [Pontibacter fetidus]